MAARLQSIPPVDGKTRRPRPEIRPDLISDQRGAMMVIGIFIATMLVGMLYYVWGIGGAILFRERMNDAADAAAFSAAVLEARGMNILVLINIVMCALAAVESGMELAAEIIDAAAIAAGLTCLGCGPWCAYCCEGCYYAVVYGADAVEANNLHSNVERVINPLMTAAHVAAQAVEIAAPAAGIVIGARYSTSAPYSPTVQIGVAVPSSLIPPSLEAEDDPTDWPCDEKVALPTLAVGEVVAPVEVSFDIFNLWYAAGAAWGLVRYEAIAEDWCPDYFQRVKDGSELGEDPFQVRSLMYGRSPHTWTRRGVAIADWGRSEGTAGWMEAFEPITYISIAQAEYFFEQPFDDDAYSREEMMWHQRWRARLRRFRMPSGGGSPGDLESTAGEAGGSLMDLSAIVVH